MAGKSSDTTGEALDNYNWRLPESLSVRLEQHRERLTKARRETLIVTKSDAARDAINMGLAVFEAGLGEDVWKLVEARREATP